MFGIKKKEESIVPPQPIDINKLDPKQREELARQSVESLLGSSGAHPVDPEIAQVVLDSFFDPRNLRSLTKLSELDIYELRVEQGFNSLCKSPVIDLDLRNFMELKRSEKAINSEPNNTLSEMILSVIRIIGR